MATIRAYTTIEQSRKLAEFLPLESADMCYVSKDDRGIEFFEEPDVIDGTLEDVDIRCWSLAALFGVLLNGTNIIKDEPDKYDGAVGQIKSLLDHKDNDAAYFYIFIQGKFGYLLKEVCSDDIRPIPLTPEILEKNGFERTWQDNFVYDNEDIGLIITFHPKETNYTNGTYDYIDIEKGCVTITEMPIEFVHQLQHVLRLCEVSIEIIEL